MGRVDGVVIPFLFIAAIKSTVHFVHTVIVVSSPGTPDSERDEVRDPVSVEWYSDNSNMHAGPAIK